MKWHIWLRGKSESLYQKALTVRSFLTLPASRKEIRRYLAATSAPKLQLGSGRNYLEGWLNSDFFAKPPQYVFLDATRPFPLPDATFTRIFSEHLIEHISLNAGVQMLRECYRILKPGGRIRLETPDLEKISALYATKDEPGSRSYIRWHTSDYAPAGFAPTVCFAINNASRNWGHQFMYDEEMLRAVLEKVGFVHTVRYPWSQTEDPEFQGVSQRHHLPQSIFETIVLEAEKPGA